MGNPLLGGGLSTPSLPRPPLYTLRLVGGPASRHHRPDGDPTRGRARTHHPVPRHERIYECKSGSFGNKRRSDDRRCIAGGKGIHAHATHAACQVSHAASSLMPHGRREVHHLSCRMGVGRRIISQAAWALGGASSLVCRSAAILSNKTLNVCGGGSHLQGARELVAKALALECLRGAHRQRRACYLYAFSGPREGVTLGGVLTSQVEGQGRGK